MDKPARVIGHRSTPPSGELPSKVSREAMARMAQYRTRAPKGVFHYQSHEQANRDRERWLIQAMVENQGLR
jgi:hypothetical protein